MNETIVPNCNPTRKDKKAIDNHIHFQLHENILLLTYFSPMTKELEAVFKPDMFVKNNKVASQHVIYYLLKVLNPKLIAKKIQNWPILDNKMEIQFRKEVIAYINELKTTLPNCEIPTVVASHLINPGGLKFVNLLLDLCQLVMSEVLERENQTGFKLSNISGIQQNIGYKELTKSAISHVQKLTLNIEQKNSQKLEQYNQYMDEYTTQAHSISEQIVGSKINMQKLNTSWNNKESTQFNNTTLDNLDTRISRMMKVYEKFKQCHYVLNYFTDDKNFLVYDALPESEDGPGEMYFTPSLIKDFEKQRKYCGVKMYDVHQVDQTLISSKIENITSILKQHDALFGLIIFINKINEKLTLDLMSNEGLRDTVDVERG